MPKRGGFHVNHKAFGGALRDDDGGRLADVRYAGAGFDQGPEAVRRSGLRRFGGRWRRPRSPCRVMRDDGGLVDVPAFDLFLLGLGRVCVWVLRCGCGLGRFGRLVFARLFFAARLRGLRLGRLGVGWFGFILVSLGVFVFGGVGLESLEEGGD